MRDVANDTEALFDNLLLGCKQFLDFQASVPTCAGLQPLQQRVQLLRITLQPLYTYQGLEKHFLNWHMRHLEVAYLLLKGQY